MRRGTLITLIALAVILAGAAIYQIVLASRDQRYVKLVPDGPILRPIQFPAECSM